LPSDDRFLQMFFEEARELLINLEQGLMELERRQGDRAHLDRTFRAAHTMKGSAAMVGLPDLADFTHRVESVLDRIRSQSLGVDSYVIRTLLEARDHLAAAVEAEAAGSPIPAPPDLNERLEGLLHDSPRSARVPSPAESAGPPTTSSSSPAAESAPAESASADRVDSAQPAEASQVLAEPAKPKRKPTKPRASRKKAKAAPVGDVEVAPVAEVEAAPVADVEVAPVTSHVEPGKHHYRIAFVPGPDLLRRGVNPLGVLDELRELGQAKVTTDQAAVPPLDELDPERCYLAWTITLDTEAPVARLDDVFLFVADDSRVTIEQRTTDGRFVTVRQPTVPASLEAAATHGATVGKPVAARSTTPSTVPSAAATASGQPSPAAMPAQVSSAAGAPVAPRRPPARIRVDAIQLDDLVGLAGELAVLSDNLHGIAALPGASPWVVTLEALDRVSRLIRDTTLDLRMVPVEELFSRFPRVVRDLADRSGKEIELRIEGQETRLDRTIVERLSEPMIHLIRNAVDHGLETPEERLAMGKPRAGKIMLWAGHEGDRVALRIAEDGRGLDRERIVRKGISAGLVPVGTSADDPRVDALIFEPGFSTRDQVSELSGRGVGLDVVRDAVRGLRGSFSVESVPGKGTAFIFRLPLTLALIDGLLVETGGERYVVPLAQVEECVALNGTRPALSKGRPCVSVRGELVPMVILRKLFGANGSAPTRQELLLTRQAGQRVGVAVDRLLGRVQAVIQGLGEGLHSLGRFSGATILADGSVSLILDLAALVAESRAADNHASSLRAS
jgi:two-component system, chemotaxis family, sensor kinase CheA